MFKSNREIFFIVEEVTEEVTEEAMGVTENEETPTSAVGIWLGVGLSLGLILVFVIAIKKILKWCLNFLLDVEKYFLFQSKRKQ